MGILDRLFGGHGGGHGGHHGSHGGGYGGSPQGGYPPPGGNNGAIGCPSCQALNAADARFCQRCGTSLTPAKCNQCDANLQAGAKFCSKCGKATA